MELLSNITVGHAQQNRCCQKKILQLLDLEVLLLALSRTLRLQVLGYSSRVDCHVHQDFFLRLFNPLTRVHITLPSLKQIIGTRHSTSQGFCAVEKAAVFSLHGEIVTMIIGESNDKLCLTRNGALYWDTVKFPTTVSLSDFVCLNNQILAVTMNGMLILVDMNTPSHPIKAYFAASPPAGEWAWSNLYLAESQGRLLLVLHFKGDSWNKFKVYELDVSQGKWIVVDDLGGESLFIEDYNCTSYLC